MDTKKIIIILLGLMLLIPISSAVKVEPETIELDLFGGDSVVKEFVITNTESYPIKCSLSTIILPDPVGIDVSYKFGEKNISAPFYIPSFTSYIIKIEINTSIALEPNIYSIKTKLQFTRYEESTTVTRHDSSDGIPIFYFEDEPEEIIPDKNETIPNDNTSSDNDTYVPQPPSYDYFYHYLAIVLALIISFTLLWLFKKKKEQKK